MLQEILLSLSGHPSPLLRSAAASASAAGSSSSPPSASEPDVYSAALTPPERALLAPLARLADTHIRARAAAAHLAASHPSVVCRAVAAAVDARHLAAFRAKVLDVERALLTGDAALVGAHRAVPLTEVVAEFDGWGRRLGWLERVVGVLERGVGGGGEGKATMTAKGVIDFLRGELPTGYTDVEEVVLELVEVAERAWVKQVAAWVLYGRVPGFGAERDFFVRVERRKAEDGEGEEGREEVEYKCEMGLLPGFVRPQTAASMLFIGRSLNQIRAKGAAAGEARLRGEHHLSTQLARLAALQHPIDAAAFSRAIAEIRNHLSRTVLQRLLPLGKVQETLQLLRDFFLLGRGEFAMALTHQADARMRSRWRRAENLAYERRDGLGTVAVKEGEAAAVLAKTWAAMASMQGEHSQEDEGLELARDLLRLSIAKPRPSTPGSSASAESGGLPSIAPTPFRNLLFSVPVVLTMRLPSPLDLFLTPADLQMYTAINSYLLSLRRAHIHLTDLWKISTLRRHHPAPPGPPQGSTRAGRERVQLLRERNDARRSILRNAWVTASAALFFLGELEAYLQTEVVAGLSDGFQAWLAMGEDEQPKQRDDESEDGDGGGSAMDLDQEPGGHGNGNENENEHEHEHNDVWLAESSPTTSPPRRSVQHHDPQTLATAHRAYLGTLTRRLLLTRASFTDALYGLLVQTDHLAALVRRLHDLWAAADLEADAGVIDSFVDLEREEREVRGEMGAVERRVREGIRALVAELRKAEEDGARIGDREEEEKEEEQEGQAQAQAQALGEDKMYESVEGGEYVPRRVGGVDRLLMKLDFGTWFGTDGEGLGEGAGIQG
ncbi:hypothetical protein VTJ83DRAFT_4277 [Remersonia thermophila]|uniref:Spindle pole body component n=1 Tax=Remersonia thermophila TaxID=72144 RepID=A0ABR4DA80_9PEZI